MRRWPLLVAGLSCLAGCKRSDDASGINDWPAREAAKYRASTKPRLLITGTRVGDFGQRDWCTLDDAGALKCMNLTRWSVPMPMPSAAGTRVVAAGERLPPGPNEVQSAQVPLDKARAVLDRAEADALSKGCQAELRENEKGAAVRADNGGAPPNTERSFRTQEICRGDPTKDSTASCAKICLPNLPSEVAALFPMP